MFELWQILFGFFPAWFQAFILGVLALLVITIAISGKFNLIMFGWPLRLFLLFCCTVRGGCWGGLYARYRTVHPVVR